MNSNLRQKFFAGTVIFLITVLSIPAYADAFTPWACRSDKGIGKNRHHVSPFGIWRNPKMVHELGLTDEQIKALREADFAFREKRLDLQSQLDGLHLQLEKLFSHDPVVESEVLHAAQKISALKGKRFVQKTEARLALGKLLKPNQLKQLKMHQWSNSSRYGQKNRKGYRCRNQSKFEGSGSSKP